MHVGLIIFKIQQNSEDSWEGFSWEKKKVSPSIYNIRLISYLTDGRTEGGGKARTAGAVASFQPESRPHVFGYQTATRHVHSCIHSRVLHVCLGLNEIALITAQPAIKRWKHPEMRYCSSVSCPGLLTAVTVTAEALPHSFYLAN